MHGRCREMWEMQGDGTPAIPWRGKCTGDAGRCGRCRVMAHPQSHGVGNATFFAVGRHSQRRHGRGGPHSGGEVGRALACPWSSGSAATVDGRQGKSPQVLHASRHDDGLSHAPPAHARHTEDARPLQLDGATRSARARATAGATPPPVEALLVSSGGSRRQSES